MDSHYIDPSVEVSHPSRSRSNTLLSQTASQLQDLNIKSTIASIEPGGGTSTEGPTTTTIATPSLLDPNSHPASAFTSSPTSEEYPAFPQFSQADINANWPSLAGARSSTTPLLTLDPAEQLPTDRPTHSNPSISRSNSYPVNMRYVEHLSDSISSMANLPAVLLVFNHMTPGSMPASAKRTHGLVSYIQICPHEKHANKTAFDMNDQFLLGQMSPPMPMATLGGEDQKFMPMYPRSVSSSPPRGSLTPEQRELKRQRDHARRDTKERMRRERSTSNPYSVSPRGSPELMSKSLSSDYPGTMAPSPLLSHSAQGSPNLSNISNISSPAYLAPYTPQLDGDMYGGVFPMVANDFDGAPAYTMPMTYTTPGMDASMQSYMYALPKPHTSDYFTNHTYRRPHSLSASSMDQPNIQMMQSIYNNQTPSKVVNGPESGDNVRVVHSRPKPQCWEHGCNGRQFSTFSNLLRHQREKSGAAAKSTCPNCGAEFTRTTARNGHMAHEKCKQRRAT